MATRNVSLTEKLDRFVEERVEAGDYQNASEVVRAGLRLLQAQEEAHQAKVARLRAAIQVGVDQIEGGESAVVDDIEAWFEGIKAEFDRR